jgi:hypothetical protein
MHRALGRAFPSGRRPQQSLALRPGRCEVRAPAGRDSTADRGALRRYAASIAPERARRGSAVRAGGSRVGSAPAFIPSRRPSALGELGAVLRERDQRTGEARRVAEGHRPVVKRHSSLTPSKLRSSSVGREPIPRPMASASVAIPRRVARPFQDGERASRRVSSARGSCKPPRQV